MRIVAISLFLMLVATAIPVQADPLERIDECENRLYLPTERTQSCLRFDLKERGAPQSIQDENGRYVFLWIADEGGDAKNRAGMDSVVGTLYGDTNGLIGLQRTAIKQAWGAGPDSALLI